MQEVVLASVAERRTILTDVMKYLHYGNEGSSDSDYYNFPRQLFITTIKETYVQINTAEADMHSEKESEDTQVSESRLFEISLEAGKPLLKPKHLTRGKH